MSFVDKVAIVTGVASGIGAAIALRFCDEGARVALVDRNLDGLRTMLEKCQKASGKPHTILADLSVDSDTRRIVEETLQHFGKIDILINNAGVAGDRASIFDKEKIMQAYDNVMTVNLRSVVHLTSLCAQHLVETKGNVVNISSVKSTKIASGLIYSASKAGLDHFTRCVALELAPKGVRVNTVNPGPVKTSILENRGFSEAKAEALWDQLIKATALGRASEPEEIADMVTFLASDRARSITGSSIFMDNGAAINNTGKL